MDRLHQQTVDRWIYSGHCPCVCLSVHLSVHIDIQTGRWTNRQPIGQTDRQQMDGHLGKQTDGEIDRHGERTGKQMDKHPVEEMDSSQTDG